VLLPVTAVLRARPDALVLIAPSDHGIANERAFRAGIARARHAVKARRADVVVFGLEPDAPAGDYGWITPGAPLGHDLHRVDAFVEKPGADRARELLRRGALWNTMVVLARARALVDLCRAALPSLTAVFDATTRLSERGRDGYLAECYDRLPRADFCRHVLEAAEALAVQVWPRELGWMDLGTPERLQAWLAKEDPEAGLHAAPPPEESWDSACEGSSSVTTEARPAASP